MGIVMKIESTSMVESKPKLKCAVPDCDRLASKKKMCDAHYQRWRKDPDNFDRNPVDIKKVILNDDSISYQLLPDEITVRNIRIKLALGIKDTVIARQYGLSHQVINDIRNGKIWKDIKEEK
jgi:hypothetical protein